MASCSIERNEAPHRATARVPTQLGSVPLEALREVVRRHGTPTYAYDVDSLQTQVRKLRHHLPSAVEVLYSLKANASLGLCSFFARAGLGADVASAGELATALAAGFAPARILVSGPDKSPPLLAALPALPDGLLSVDSVSELQLLAQQRVPQRSLLRLRPEFCSHATCAAGPDSRFGLLMDDLPACRAHMAGRVVGFHIFAGSQVLEAAQVIDHLRGALAQAQRAAAVLGITPEVIDLGGGFGIPYGADDPELDLAAVAAELRTLVDRAAPTRLMLELGRYLVAPSGWYLTTVLATQSHHGRPAVVVDGGSHQRVDMCGLDLRRKAFPPVVLSSPSAEPVPTDVLGCLSLPSDVLAEARPLPPLSPGDVLAFPNAGAYGLTAAPTLFHGHPPPAEVAFAGGAIEVIRPRPSAQSVLEGQRRLQNL